MSKLQKLIEKLIQGITPEQRALHERKLGTMPRMLTLTLSDDDGEVLSVPCEAYESKAGNVMFRANGFRDVARDYAPKGRMSLNVMCTVIGTKSVQTRLEDQIAAAVKAEAQKVIDEHKCSEDVAAASIAPFHGVDASELA
jgi:hypothetical protein